MTRPVIAVMGAGNMGSSLIQGLVNNGHPADNIWASDVNASTLSALQQRLSIHTTSDNAKAIEFADVVIFAVKPQTFSAVAKSLASQLLRSSPLVISIAAGIRTTHIQHWLGGDIAIVRAMPNMPALIGCGATALFANPFVNSVQHNLAESILRAVGLVVWLANEDMIDTVTALSGSGPAYFFLVMEILQQVGEELGLPRETARLLTLETALGAARLAIESGEPLTELRRLVTSPHGTTEKALSVLEQNNIRGMFKKALQAGQLRAKELADTLGRDS